MVLHIITGLDVGGAEQSLKKLLLSSLNTKDKAVVVSLTDIGDIGKSLENSGVKVHSLGISGIHSVPFAFYKLLKLIKVIKPDIVQTWLYHADLIGGVAAKLMGVKNVIWSIRTTELKKSAVLTALIRKILAVLSYVIPRKIVCVAYSSQKKHVALGYSAKKILVIGNGYEASSYKMPEHARSLFRNEIKIENEIVIGVVGRFDADKGLDLFIKAAALIIATHPKVKFLMIGKGLNNENSELGALLKEGNVTDSFILLGQRNDIAHCLSAMDIFCLPSRTEGFPNALAEAMCSGLPCVSTQVGDVKYLLSDSGIIVKPNDHHSLASGLKDMLNCTIDQRQRYGDSARSRVSEHFSMEVTRAKYDILYAELINRSVQ